MSYKKLGNIVKFISNKNIDGSATILYGINIDKFFMPSVANTIGVDLTKYKVVVKNQFACNRMHVGRDKRLPISMSTFDYPFIVSPAYDVFEVIDENVIPEYLMLWFRRTEFDRQCWFYTDADVRGGLSLDALKSIEIRIPSIDTQRQLVAQYQAVENKIKVNEQICHKLEATAQTLYKQWFVDFEFPNEEGLPYKSSGGAMLYNQELEKEIPVGWEVKRLEDIVECKDGTHDSPKEVREGNKLITSIHINKFNIDLNNAYNISEIDFIQVNKRSKVDYGDILVSMIGTVGNVNLVTYRTVNFAIKNLALIKTSNYLKFVSFLYLFLNSVDFKIYLESELNGSTQKYITLSFIRNIKIVYHESIIKLFHDNIFEVFEYIINNVTQNQHLTQLQSLLLSRLATLEG